MRSYCVKYTLGGQKIIDIRLQFAWKKYIESILSVYGKIDKGVLFITYAGLTNDELEKIKDQVKSKGNVSSKVA